MAEDELITREEATKRFPISMIELRRRQRLGEIKPVKRGAKNVLFFKLSDVKELYERRVRQKADYTKGEAAAAFKEFEKGKNAIQAVVELAISPEAAESLYITYLSMKGALLLPETTLKQIEAMEIDGPLPLKSPDDLIDLLTGILKLAMPKCPACKTHDARFCKSCAREYGIKKAAQENGTAEL